MIDQQFVVTESALGGMQARPMNFDAQLNHYSGQLYPGFELSQQELAERLRQGSSDDSVKILFERKFQEWDSIDQADWAEGTQRQTTERRQLAYGLMGLTEALSQILTEVCPPYIPEERLILIAQDHEPWYRDRRESIRNFYWDAYREYLRNESNWPGESIQELDFSTDQVMDRIADPSRLEQYQSKGLVVGYVQSGKTANFTGLIAKAADAGYRLFIVLAGTVNLLRNQTQRRIDKELIGRDLLEDDYIDDAEWEQFVNHGERPSNLGAFDWHRLTGPEDDYRSLKRGIESLEFERRDHTRPFFDPGNLRYAPARLMVIKKIPSRLNAVARDLERIRARLDDIPVLVIDDESDQASINTLRPPADVRREERQRTRTNEAISGLLNQLPRAQYVGYTATPFANVFVDPDDTEDIFPKDFILSLSRPVDYMGASDFHDIDDFRPGEKGPNERDYIRDVYGDDLEPDNLVRAIDSFVLSGALKLFRTANSEGLRFKHHTMLVHESHLIADHAELAETINNLFDEAGYNAGPGYERLEELWSSDFQPVCMERAHEGWPIPNSFEDLRAHIGDCLRRIDDGERRVLIVNGNNTDPTFDGPPVWKILVGGTKLSRGYTVEGLTISYYRRRTIAADTLMQMGRWFGFRRGFRDLVRLFVGREEPPDSRNPLDLYAAFEAVCRDEIDFRSELERYVNFEEGPRITPAQIPPLVSAHLLLPTSRDKMFNAMISSQNFARRQAQSTKAPYDVRDISANQALMRGLLEDVAIVRETVGIEGDTTRQFQALIGTLGTNDVIEFLQNYRWIDNANPLARQIEFLHGHHGNPEIEQWLFMAPQLGSQSPEWGCEDIAFRTVVRSRTHEEGRFGVYSDPWHIQVSRYLGGTSDDQGFNQATRARRHPQQGIFLFYPVREKPRGPRVAADPNVDLATMGFALLFPNNQLDFQIRFTVARLDQPDEIVVDPPAG